METDSESGYGQTSSDVLYFLQEYLHDTGLFAKKAGFLPKVWEDRHVRIFGPQKDRPTANEIQIIKEA